MINSPHQDLFSRVPYLCSSIRLAVNSSNKMLSVDQILMSLSVLSLPGWLHLVTSRCRCYKDVIISQHPIMLSSASPQFIWCALGWSLPGSQWMGEHYTGVIWVSVSSFMTWVRGETYQFIHSRKVRAGINNSVLKCIEYRFYLVFEGILYNEIESSIRPLLWAWTQTTAGNKWECRI